MPYKDYEKQKEHARIRDKTPKRIKEEKERHLLRTYNMTLEQWNLLYSNQNGICANPHCDKSEHGRLPLYVDHDHETGKVRGLLCARCNTDLGRLEDKNRIEGLYLYLEQHAEGKYANIQRRRI